MQTHGFAEVALVNEGFGNRCQRCGHPFDDGGICNNFHQQGEHYTLSQPQQEPVKKTCASPSTKEYSVRCEVFSGCRCTICTGFFADGDDICSLGGHEIGQFYLMQKT